MTILLTADCVGGVWTYALDLIRALPQHNFVLATMGDLPTASQRQLVESLPHATLRESPWKLEWMDEPWNDVKHAGRWLLELEREFEPDLIHLNGYTHAALPFAAPVIVVAQSCVLSWWRAVRGEDAPASWDYYRLRVTVGLQGADIVVSPSGAYLNELLAIYGEFGPSRVINNGAALPPYILHDKEPFVLCAGRLWDKAKNIAVLDQVDTHIAAPVRVAGAQTQGTQGFVASHVDLLGVLDQSALFDLTGQAAIWVHPARYEPFGLAVLEAAGRDCSLVLSDIPTLRELWEGAALFVEPDDVEGWSRTLQYLLDSPKERSQCAQQARERAKRYSLELFGAGYSALYEELTR